MASINFLYFLDNFLDFTHIFLVLFILFGWLYPRFRITHLVVLLLTGFSWLIFSKGNTFGHCILTDWHWHILRKLGETNLPETYTQYMFERMTGIPVQKATALTITRSSWLLSLTLSSVLVFRKYICERRIKVTD
jgi:hypothetical protein